MDLTTIYARLQHVENNDTRQSNPLAITNKTFLKYRVQITKLHI